MPQAAPPAADDQRLCQRIRERLTTSGYSALQCIQVRSSQGHVVLDGEVPTYHLKQIAQTLSLPVEGVSSLANKVAVRSASRF